MVSQVQLLNKILQTKDFSPVILNNLDESYFFNYIPEFNFIKNHYDTYGKVPDRLTFANAFPEFDLVDVAEPDSYLLSQVISDYNSSYLAIRFNHIKKLLEADKTDEAVQYFLKSAENMRPTVSMTCTNIMSDTSRYDHYLDRALGRGRQYYKTGFDEIDYELGGIDPENENMIIAARPGIGKSWCLIKMAVAASQQGLTVGLYSGEMSTDKVGYRIDTLLGRISNKAINRGDPLAMAQYKQYIDSLKTRQLGAIKIITPNDINGPATVAALEAFIAREKLDILFVDQYSLLEDIHKAKAIWEKVGNISRDMKLLQVKAKIPIISVSQMNRTKNEDENGKKTQDTSQIGLADRIGQDATVVIMLDQDKEAGTLTLNIVKARDGGDGHKYTYKIDLNTGEFRYINEGMSDEAATALQNSYDIESTLTNEELPKPMFSNLPWDN